MKITEILEGVGRVVKGVNTTVDVGPNQISIEAAKLGFKVDKDGRPKNAITETKNYQNFVKFCCQGLKLKSKPNISLTSEKFDDTFGKFDPNTNKLVIRVADRHPVDVMRTIAHELVHLMQQEKGLELDGSDGSPHENEANMKAGVLMRKWASRHPKIFENYNRNKK